MNLGTTNALIAIGVTSAVGYAFFAHMKNRSRRPRASGNDSAGHGGGTTSDYASSGSWFADADTSNATGSGACATGDSGGGGDCGGGGDGGGGD